LASIGDLPELNVTSGLSEMGDAIEQQVIEFPADPNALVAVVPGEPSLETPPAISPDIEPILAADDTKTQEVIHEAERLDRSEPEA
jgi:hypothetical protein